jgi:hypothetical protein
MIGLKKQDWTQKRPNRLIPALNPIFGGCKDLCPYWGLRKGSFRISVNEVVIRSATEMEHIHGGGFGMFDTYLYVLTARVLREAAAESEDDERRMHREGDRNLTRSRI